MTYSMNYFRQLLLAIITILFSHQLYATSDKNDVFYKVQKTGEITVGVSILSPWVMKNKEGKLIGFEIDIANQLAKDMNVKVRFKEYLWDKIIPALKKGEIDVIASGLSITPKRALEINFSNPYSSSGYSLVTCLTLTKDFTSINDLNNEKVYITAVKGTISADIARKVFPQAKLDFKETEKDATSAVVDGSAHAFIASSPIPEFISLEHPEQVDLPLKKPLLTTKEAFAVKKGNPEILNFLNAWIVTHQADEWINNSYQYWFNSLKWQPQVIKKE